MRRISVVIILIFIIILVVFARPAISAAQNSVILWLYTLLPTLFPFFICATLLDQLGVLHSFAAALSPLSALLKISPYALPLLFIGGVSGYPSGARLVGMLQQSKEISNDEAEQLATLCNLCSPMFLIGALSITMLKNRSLFIPLAIGHYAGAIITALIVILIKPAKLTSLSRIKKHPNIPLHSILPKTISNGMTDMLKVGGTVVFFSVFAELLFQSGTAGIIGAPLNMLFPTSRGVTASQGIILGLLEMSGGCNLLAQTNLPIITKTLLCAFIVSFGGISVFMQAMSFVEFQKPARYLFIKLLHGTFAALITYILIDKRLGLTDVFAQNSSEPIINAISLGAVIAAATLSMAVSMLLGIMLGKSRSK